MLSASTHKMLFIKQHKECCSIEKQQRTRNDISYNKKNKGLTKICVNISPSSNKIYVRKARLSTDKF